MSAALRRSFSSLEAPNYRRYFAGQLVSLTGNWTQIVAEIWLVLALTDSALAVGVTMALQFAGILVLGAWGGLLADRLPKRSLLLVTQAAMALPALALFAITATGIVEAWMVYGLVAVRGLVNAIDNPTRQSFAIEMVGAERVVSAVGLNSVLIHSARILGPATAGVLITTMGVAPCFLINALSFGAMIVALRSMDASSLHPAPPAPRERGAIRAALRYVAATPALAVPLAMMALVGTLGFNFQVILPVLARFTFDGGAGAYTALAVAMGVGSVAGALATGALGRIGSPVLTGSALGFGALALLAAAAPTLPLEALVLVPLGAATVVFAAGINSSLQLAAAPEMRGRVMALYSIVFLGSTPIGGPIAGWLAEALGPRAGLVMTAFAALVAALGGAIAFGQLPRPRRPALGRWRRRVSGGRAIATEPRGANQLDRLQRRRGLDVETDAVALFDGRHRRLAASPGERDQDRVTGADGRHSRPDPGDDAADERERADRPQAPEGDPSRALGRQARRRPRPRQRPRHRFGGAGRAPQLQADDRGREPPDAGDDQRRRVRVAVGGEHGDDAEHGRHAGDQQHRHPHQVAEEHQPGALGRSSSRSRSR